MIRGSMNIMSHLIYCNNVLAKNKATNESLTHFILDLYKIEHEKKTIYQKENYRICKHDHHSSMQIKGKYCCNGIM